MHCWNRSDQLNFNIAYQHGLCDTEMDYMDQYLPREVLKSQCTGRDFVEKAKELDGNQGTE